MYHQRQVYSNAAVSAFSKAENEERGEGRMLGRRRRCSASLSENACFGGKSGRRVGGGGVVMMRHPFILVTTIM